MSLIFLVVYQAVAMSSASLSGDIPAQSAFLSVCEVSSKNASNEIAVKGVMISDGEHFNILKSSRCPAVSVNYALDADRIESNSPSFWKSFAAADHSNVGLQMFCVKAMGKMVKEESGRFLLIQRVVSFKRARLKSAARFDITHIKCSFD